MRKVNLDLEFEKWKQDNEEHLIERFLELHDFNDYLEEAWQEHQKENGLIDESNEESLEQPEEIEAGK
jgi:hypothetical protein